MAVRKLNVLVYTGTGATSESVRHCIFSLRQLLSPNYAVIPVNETVILKEPWPATCALLVFPGGADLGYCRALNGEGNRRISDYVRRGGAYLGFCAGGYYGSRRCEFEVGDRALEVIGSRELGFFPGTCRGAAFGGFDYQSEKGARAVTLKVEREAFGGSGSEDDGVPAETTSYFNGGGVFVDAKSFGASKVEVLATFEDELHVDGGDGKAAVVLCTMGNGKALLTGPHPEFAAINLSPKPHIPHYEDLMAKLAAADKSRIAFLKACLGKLGLEPNETTQTIPSLSPLHLSSINDSGVTEMLCSWESIMDRENGMELIRGEADTFLIQTRDSQWDMDEIQESLPQDGGQTKPEEEISPLNYESVVKKIVAHETGLPSTEQTPRFDHQLYYSSLRRFQLVERSAANWGNNLLYGDVVTSTNTLLDKNPKLLANLPTGFTLAACTQVAGRGRGTNVWIAPPGALIHSTVINHPGHLSMSRPIVFIQYIAAIAIVEAIQSYGQGYEKLPVKIKWPNDIYALDPSKPESKEYVKIAGILSQCGYFNGSYQVVLGIGINTINPRPTTSLSDLLPPNAAPLHIETLLARLLTRLEATYAQFLREGFSEDLERRYYRHWLHTGQLVFLEAEGGVLARVVGITRDWGMLRVEETDREGRATGKMWALQSDENSFDYWKGLVRKRL